jgi:hypothetical protein
MLGPPAVATKPLKAEPALVRPPHREEPHEEDDATFELHDDALDAPITDEVRAIDGQEKEVFEERSYQRNQRRRDEDAKNIVHGMGVTALKTITIFGLILTTVYVMQLIGISWLKPEAVAKIETIITYGWTVYFAGIVTQFVTVSKPPADPTTN